MALKKNKSSWYFYLAEKFWPSLALFPLVGERASDGERMSRGEPDVGNTCEI